MTKSLSKVNLASIKVLNFLQLLLSQDLSMNDLISRYRLYHNEECSNFVISKYINTIRYCGISVEKVNQEYKITKFPIGLKFSDLDLSILNDLKNCCEKVRIPQVVKNMNSIIERINKRIGYSLEDVSYFLIKNPIIIDFEKACETGQKIRLILENNNILTCDPIKILVEDNSVSILVFNKNESREFNINEITSLEISPQKSSQMFIPTTVIFELKGSLAKNYQVRNNEEVLDITSDGKLLIKNRFEDKIKLIHRLMRYGDNCKLISPKSYVLDMTELLDRTLSNYN